MTSLVNNNTSVRSPVTSSSFSSEQRSPWKEIAGKMITNAQVRYSMGDIERFGYFINANKDKINQRVFIASSTIFHELAKKGSPLEFVSILSENGVDFSLQEDFMGNTPLLWALANGQNDMAKEIVEQIPPSQLDSMDKQCNRGNSMLHLIIGKGYINKTKDEDPIFCSSHELLRLAINKGANFNLANRSGNTPLHLAYARRDYSMIKLLIDNGADQDYLNNAGHTPKDMICLSGREERNFEEANKVMNDTVGYFFILKENDYKDPMNLRRIRAL